MDGQSRLHAEEIGRQLSLVCKKAVRFSETHDRHLGAATCEVFHAAWLSLSVTIATSLQPGAKNCSMARLLIVPDLGREQCEKRTRT
jgi:hypothetical protein